MRRPRNRFRDIPREGRKRLTFKSKKTSGTKKPAKKFPFFPKSVLEAKIKKSPNNSELYLLHSKGNISTFAITLGEKIISQGSLLKIASEVLRNKALAREKVAEISGYTLNDLLSIGDVPKVGSQATGKISVIEKSNKKNISLQAIAFPSKIKISERTRLDLKRTFFRRLVSMLEQKSQFKGKSSLQVKIKKNEIRLRTFLEQKLGFKELTKTEFADSFFVMHKKI